MTQPLGPRKTVKTTFTSNIYHDTNYHPPKAYINYTPHQTVMKPIPNLEYSTFAHDIQDS